MSRLLSFFARFFSGLPEGYYFKQFLSGTIYAFLVTVTFYFLLEFAAPLLVKVFPFLITAIVAWRDTTQEEIQIAGGVLTLLTLMYPYSRFMYSRFFRSLLNLGAVYMPIKTMITLNFYNGLASWVLAPVLAPVCFVYLFFLNKPNAKRQA